MDFPISSVKELDSISEKVKWQYFEKLVAFIFEKNGYDVRQNVVILKGDEKRQFDVIAVRYGKTYLVECKKWKGKNRTGGLRNAAEKHYERCEFYGGEKPLIVTLADDQIQPIIDIPIVPISKLNGFINSPDA